MHVVDCVELTRPCTPKSSRMPGYVHLLTARDGIRTARGPRDVYLCLHTSFEVSPIQHRPCVHAQGPGYIWPGSIELCTVAIPNHWQHPPIRRQIAGKTRLSRVPRRNKGRQQATSISNWDRIDSATRLHFLRIQATRQNHRRGTTKQQPQIITLNQAATSPASVSDPPLGQTGNK
jgi:hypothetical protein